MSHLSIIEPSATIQDADYGGLYREVRLIAVPKEHFELVKDGTPGIKVTPVVDLENRCARVTVETWQNAGPVTITVNGESQTVPSESGHAQAEFLIENVRLWDGADDPYLYTAAATLDSGDGISARFGCRAYHCDPEKGFGLGQGEKPDIPVFTANRTGDLDMNIHIQAQENTLGYNILFGQSPEKLYHSYMLFHPGDQRIGALIKERNYYVRVDAFNECGITEGICVKL